MRAPFRADHVGSLLRPASLHELREKVRRGQASSAELKAAEDQAIREVVRLQEEIGIPAVTDGEFRRDWWHIDFLAQLDGVEIHKMAGPGFGGTEEQPPIPKIAGKVKYAKPVMIEDFAFMKSNTS